MLRVVGQVLVEVGERVGVLGEVVVEDAVLVAVAAPAELVQVDDEERRDVVRPAAQVVLPVALREEAEARGRRVGVALAEGRHADGRAAERRLSGSAALTFTFTRTTGAAALGAAVGVRRAGGGGATADGRVARRGARGAWQLRTTSA